MKKKTISNLGDHLGYWLRCLSNYVHYSFAERLTQYEISVPQWVVLRTLYDKENITLIKAAKLIGVDTSSLSRMIDRLVQKKLVDRTSGNDRRSLNLALTHRGQDLVPLLCTVADENDNAFFSPLSHAQQHEMKETIKYVLKVNGWNQKKHGNDRMK